MEHAKKISRNRSFRRPSAVTRALIIISASQLPDAVSKHISQLHFKQVFSFCKLRTSIKMSAVDRIVSALNDAIVAEDNAAIIDAGNKLLALDSSDCDAFQAVVTAHLNESEYNEAYSLLQKLPQLTATFPFLHSYCLYRLNRFEDALTIIGSGNIDKAHVALKAQCLYRCGKCAEVISLYTDLLDDPDFNRTELLTNICAAAAGAGLSRDFLKQYREELGESVDLLYNSRCTIFFPPYEHSFNSFFFFGCSCAAIEAGENALASDFLQRAEALGRENELDDDDIAVHRCQRAYLDFCAGNKDTAVASFKVRFPLFPQANALAFFVRLYKPTLRRRAF